MPSRVTVTTLAARRGAVVDRAHDGRSAARDALDLRRAGRPAVRSAVQALVLRHQLVLRLGVLRVGHDAVGRAHVDALRLVVRADAFGALVRVDDVDGAVGADRLVGQTGLQASQAVQSS